MLKKLFFITALFVFLSYGAFGQQRIIREEYLKITPYLSTLEDVTKIYGNGDNIIRGREDFLSIDYEIDENREVSVSYFRDCNQADKPEKHRTWIGEDIFFTFKKDLKTKPKNIFLNKKDFTACPYGDVGGQIIFFNKEDNIQFTYLSLVKAVTDLRIEATEKNRKRYKCKQNEVTFTLDPKGFRCADNK